MIASASVAGPSRCVLERRTQRWRGYGGSAGIASGALTMPMSFSALESCSSSSYGLRRGHCCQRRPLLYQWWVVAWWVGWLPVAMR